MVDSKKTNQSPVKIMNAIKAVFEVHQKPEEK